MKAKFLWIAGAAMIASLASCSKDVTTDADDGGFAPENANVAYAKLDIRLGGPGTRAELKFDEGTTGERNVKSVMLAIYNENGELIGYGSTTPSKVTDSDDNPNPDPGNITDRYYTKIVELEMIGKKTENMSVVAYCNTTKAELLDLDRVMKSTTNIIGNTTDGLVMTNSAYYEKDFAEGENNKNKWPDDNKWIVATPVTDGSFYSTKEAAELDTDDSHVTIIYVERMAAKLSVALQSSNDTADVDIYRYAGAESTATPVKVDLKFDTSTAKWAPSGTAKQMYWLKNPWTETNIHTAETFGQHLDKYGEVVGLATDPWTVFVNDKAHKRSYWAAGAYYEDDYSNLQKNDLDYVSYKDIQNANKGFDFTGSTPAITYIPEHTYGQKVISSSSYNEIGAATGIMALGQYKVYASGTSNEIADYKKKKTEQNQEKTYFDFYLLLTEKGYEPADGGAPVKDKYTIFSQEELMVYMLERSVGDRKCYWSTSMEKSASDDTYHPVASSLISTSNVSSLCNFGYDSEKKQYYITWKGSMALYTYEGEYEVGSNGAVTGKFTQHETGEENLLRTNAVHYNEGFAYFFKPIEHLSVAGLGKYGVVRNHHYALTVTSFKNLGTALDDDHFGDNEEEPIVPDPDVVALIRAELEVLAWNKVEQDVAW